MHEYVYTRAIRLVLYADLKPDHYAFHLVTMVNGIAISMSEDPYRIPPCKYIEEVGTLLRELAEAYSNPVLIYSKDEGRFIGAKPYDELRTA